MSNVARLPSAAGFTEAQLRLIRQTVAADTNNAEFDLFIAAARHANLDPFRKQISAIVFNKGNAEKRKMSIITTIDGFRVIAARTGQYRPDDAPPIYTYDPSLKGPTNPLGIVSAVVRVFKRDQSGDWYVCPGEAYWDEFAPIKPVWRNNQKTDEMSVDGNWQRMPRVMIAKCAEAQALRRAFPDAFSGLYEASELDAAQAMEATASEVIEAGIARDRLARIGGPSLLVAFDPGQPLESVPLGQFADRVSERLSLMVDVRQVDAFQRTNTEALKQFWAHSAGDALEVKKLIEARRSELDAEQ